MVKAADTDTAKALTHDDFLCSAMGITGGEWRQKRGENEGREARNVAQSWLHGEKRSFAAFRKSLNKKALPGRFELPTNGLEIRCSIP